MKSCVSGFNLTDEVRKNISIAENLTIYDTTLRDGEQTPGVAFTPQQKLEIAIKLDELGIQEIEAGFPSVSRRERIGIKKIVDQGLNLKVLSLARANIKDVDYALKCGVDGVIIFFPTSHIHLKYKVKARLDEIIEKGIETVEYAKDHGIWTQLSCEDGTRSDIDALLKVYKIAEELKTDRVGLADTVGCIHPTAMKSLISTLRKEIKIPMAVHCHNDFGLAVANSLAAVEAGINAVSCTVNGIGERGGNASLEEVIMSLYILYGVDLGFRYSVLSELSELVSRYSGIDIPPNKAIVGKNVFRHESGIHVAAVLENSFTYEPYLPQIVGKKRELVYGKHSGFRGVLEKLKELNYNLSEEEVDSVVYLVKEYREDGYTITDDLIREFAERVKKGERYVLG